MKILYSQIQKLVPDLKATPEEAGDILTMIGFMMDNFEEVVYQDKKDYLIGLEVRQNRADCLSTIGIARELAAYYGIKVVLDKNNSLEFGDKNLEIEINASEVVKRIKAVQINNLTNKQSPDWLKDFLTLYNVNSVNLLVDLSNYVMIYTGFTSHLLDKNKIQGDSILWSINRDFEKIITLDGSEIELQKNNELIIHDSKNILALAGIVGGQAAAIDINTKSIILEMAVYDRTIVRQNSRSLKIVTEASTRLEKDLDPNGLDYAMELLTSLVLENCKGDIVSQIHDYYPEKRTTSEIKLDPKLPSIYAGIEISQDRIMEILKNLRFEPWVDSDGIILVKPPTDRMDISIIEDLVEEVVRMVGFYNIPSDQIPKLDVIPEITPIIIKLSDKIRDILVCLSLDEILSLPLVKKNYNQDINHINWQEVATQNSINEEYPNLRQSIASGLLIQLKEYTKKNVEHIGIFEIGKVFGKQKGEYQEHESLGVLVKNKDIDHVRLILEKLLLSLGTENINYFEADIKPKLANPYSCWNVIVSEKSVGVFYKFKSREDKNENIYFFEINLETLVDLLGKTQHNPVVEINQKLVALDTNLEISKDKSIMDYIKKLKKKVDDKNLWNMVVQDVFPLPEGKVRYTIRTTYQEMSDQEAKRLHKEVFGL